MGVPGLVITVVIPTLNCERTLVPTLSALVSGSAAGIVREVILADGGSTDETEKIADVAGCHFLKGPHDPGARLRAAAHAARSAWLLFLDPAATLSEGWMREVRAFIETMERSGRASMRAATFRLGYEGFGLTPRLAEAAAAARLVVIGRPRAEQGLLIARRFYDHLGGHPDGKKAQERLAARIGRRRMVTLRTRLVLANS
ncbi:MAG TPA: glycosyltransferase [Xanthobacteraceae bacterium]|nr:glycosyltransferase [Xanthobacteraceae bacterium]